VFFQQGEHYISLPQEAKALSPPRDTANEVQENDM